MTDPVFERYKEALKRGHVAVFRGRPREALGHYEEAARLAGHRPLPFMSMGSVLLQMGRAQEAVAAYDEALRRAPDDRQAMSGKAQALAAAGRREEAAELARRVSELEAQENRSRNAAASAQEHGWAGGPERLLFEAEDARSRGDRAAALEGFERAARAYMERGALDAALDACHRALAVSLAAPGIHLAMVVVYLRRGWRDLGVERLVLLDRLLWLDGDQAARGALAALAAEYRGLHPEVDRMAGVAG